MSDNILLDARIGELEAELYAMTEDRNIVLETSQQQFTRIEELEGKLAWQPIETAPKDGTEIIVGASLPWHGWRCDMVAWDKNRTMWWDNNGLPYQPTHWMSLPAPPSQN